MPKVVGLDIGSRAFRAAEISKQPKKNSYILEKAVTCDYCASPEPAKNKDSLKQFVAEANFSTREVVLAIPESQVFSTILTLPFQSEKEITNYLEAEGGKVFPKPLQELVYSFVTIGPNEVNKAQTDVNVVASSKQYVLNLFDLAKAAGLNVLAAESEAYATVRALLRSQKTGPNEALLITTVGSADVDIMVVKGNYVRFSRNVSLGGITFTKAIAQALQVTEEQAEEYRKSYGFDDSVLEGKIIEAMKPVAETLLTEIKRTLNYYSSRNTFSEFKKVIFSGGSAVMPGLLAYSAENLGMEVELANPFSGITFSPKLEKTKETLVSLGPVYAVPIGLALKEGV
ncbi:type IV pilus assembly protein PilM [Patescibacteria group bacterium]|nr:type IV pilus assembly protein PilM [Patescibacteria group bacterium]